MRLVFMNLDCHGLDLFGLVMPMIMVVVVVVVVAMIAVRAVNMHRLGCWRRRGRVLMCVAVRMPTGAVRAALGFKRFLNFMDDQMHGAPGG